MWLYYHQEVVMVTKVLSEVQKNDLYKYYKYIYCCLVCKEFYGSDYIDDSKLCPIHSNKGENFKR